MSITLGSNTLNYTTNGDKYIITYISADCNPVLRYIDTIFNSLFPHFEASRRYSSNRCGELAEYVCKHLVKINNPKNIKTQKTRLNKHIKS